MFFRRGSQSVARSQHLIRIPIVRGMLKRLAPEGDLFFLHYLDVLPPDGSGRFTQSECPPRPAPDSLLQASSNVRLRSAWYTPLRALCTVRLAVDGLRKSAFPNDDFGRRFPQLKPREWK